MRHTKIMLAAAIAMLTAMQTGCTKPETENVEPLVQTAETNGQALTSLEGTTWFSHADEQLHFPGAGIYSDIHSVADYWITFEENTGMRIVEGETDMFGPDSLTETFSYTFDASTGRIVISDTYSSLSGQLSGEVEMVYDPEHSTIRWTHPMMDSVYHLVK